MYKSNNEKRRIMYDVVKTKEDIDARLKELADQLNKDFAGVDVLDVICLLNGASVLCADLIKLIQVPIRLHHFGFTAYEDAPISGEVKIDQDLRDSIQGRKVLLLEGLIISGRTPRYLLNFFKLRNPETIKICAVGVKNESVAVDLIVDYRLFDFTDEWIEGYGIGSDFTKCLPYLVDKRS